MPTKSPDVDAYIAAAEPFAQPILKKLRKLMHRGCPDVVEVIKWRIPHFEHHGLLASVSAYQRHVTFAFWRGTSLPNARGAFSVVGNTTMTAMKFASLDEIPEDELLLGLIREAVALNESTPAKSARHPASNGGVTRSTADNVPEDLQIALRSHPAALKLFQGFSPSHRREYVNWIAEAKRPATRSRRIEQTIERLLQDQPHPLPKKQRR
jgi:hypothetical protein